LYKPINREKQIKILILSNQNDSRWFDGLTLLMRLLGNLSLSPGQRCVALNVLSLN